MLSLLSPASITPAPTPNKQRWYARDAASVVQQPQQPPAYTGYVATLDIDVPAALLQLSTAAASGGDSDTNRSGDNSTISSQHQLRLWSAETPHLYLLLIKLQLGGQVVEVEGCQVRVFVCVAWSGL